MRNTTQYQYHHNRAYRYLTDKHLMLPIKQGENIYRLTKPGGGTITITKHPTPNMRLRKHNLHSLHYTEEVCNRRLNMPTNFQLVRVYYREHRCTNPKHQLAMAMATTFCTVVPNICGNGIRFMSPFLHLQL